MRDHLTARLSTFKRPRILQFVESLPKMGSGKLDRVSIKATYGASQPAT
jgi:acyl-coenzyme A synthetase/AMP-(fatty) acid ligase